MKVQKTLALALIRTLGFSVLLLGGFYLGCGPSVQEKVRMGDFEFSQGNFPNALRRYNEAWKIDSTCPGLREKISDMRKRLSRSN